MSDHSHDIRSICLTKKSHPASSRSKIVERRVASHSEFDTNHDLVEESDLVDDLKQYDPSDIVSVTKV